MTQLQLTATRNTIDSATIIDHIFHFQFFDNPDCCIIDAGLADQRVLFAKVPFCYKNYDDTEITSQVYLLELLCNNLEMPNLYYDPAYHIGIFFQSSHDNIEQCSSVRQSKKSKCKPPWFQKKIENAISKRKQALKRFRENPISLIKEGLQKNCGKKKFSSKKSPVLIFFKCLFKLYD